MRNVILIVFISLIGSVFGSLISELDFSQQEMSQLERDTLYESLYIDKIENIVVKIESPDSIFRKEFTSLTSEERVSIIRNWIEYMKYRNKLLSLVGDYKEIHIEPGGNNSIENSIYLSGVIAGDIFDLRVIKALGDNTLLKRFLNEPRIEAELESESYFNMKQSLTDENSLINIINNYPIENIIAMILGSFGQESLLAKNILKNMRGIEELLKSDLLNDNSLEAHKMKWLQKWYAFEKWVALAATGIDYSNRPQKFVTEEKIEEIRDKLLPGDILLKRSNWQVTNFGITGFWTHSGLYLGSIKELSEFFDGIKTAKGLSITEYLIENKIEVYDSLALKPVIDGNCIIEGIAAGVVINRLENIAAVDYFAALRPRLSKKEKMKAIIRAIEFLERPYDYRFDLVTDNAMICSEVIYKSYLAGEGMKGLTLELIQNDLRLSFAPNDFAKKFDMEFNSTDRELDLVVFYDASEKHRESYLSTVEEFRKTWTRPYLDIFRK